MDLVYNGPSLKKYKNGRTQNIIIGLNDGRDKYMMTNFDLTPGVVYNIEIKTSSIFIIRDNTGTEREISQSLLIFYFKTKEDHRDNILDQLGII